MIVTDTELLESLEVAIEAAGTLKAFCLKHKLDASKVSRIRTGQRGFSKDVLKVLKAKPLKTFNVPDSLVIGAPGNPKPKLKFEDIE